MCETLIVADIAESLERRNARLQDTGCHLGLDATMFSQEFYILPEKAMQWLLPRNRNATLRAE